MIILQSLGILAAISLFLGWVVLCVYMATNAKKDWQTGAWLALAFGFPLWLLLTLVFFANTLSYSTEREKELAYQDNLSCSYSQCPLRIQEAIVEEHNGLLPPSELESQSWEWIRSVCTYSPEICV